MEQPSCECAQCRFDFYKEQLKVVHAKATFFELQLKKAAQQIVDSNETSIVLKHDAEKVLIQLENEHNLLTGKKG